MKWSYTRPSHILQRNIGKILELTVTFLFLFEKDVLKVSLIFNTWTDNNETYILCK